MNQTFWTDCGYSLEEMEDAAVAITKLWIEATKAPYTTDEKKEDTTMQVTCNGFTGELVKLERKFNPMCGRYDYDLSIYDSEKKVTYSFTGVKQEYFKFLGGVVAFGG